MAIELNDAGGASGYRRTTNLPTGTSFTLMMWARITTDSDGWQTFFEQRSAFPVTLQTLDDGVTLNIYNGSDNPGTALSVGVWYHVALTHTSGGSSTDNAYLNGVLGIGPDTTSPNDATTSLQVGVNASDSEQLFGRVAAFKAYSAVLTAAEMAQEMRQYLPVRTANLNTFAPFLSTVDDQVDYSGVGGDWTLTGSSYATADGPPIPWAMGRRRVLLSAAAPALRFILGTH